MMQFIVAGHCWLSYRCTSNVTGSGQMERLFFICWLVGGGGGFKSTSRCRDMWYINVTVKRVLDFQYSFSVITIFFLLLIYYN